MQAGQDRTRISFAQVNRTSSRIERPTYQIFQPAQRRTAAGVTCLCRDVRSEAEFCDDCFEKEVDLARQRSRAPVEQLVTEWATNRLDRLDQVPVSPISTRQYFSLSKSPCELEPCLYTVAGTGPRKVASGGGRRLLAAAPPPSPTCEPFRLPVGDSDFGRAVALA